MNVWGTIAAPALTAAGLYLAGVPGVAGGSVDAVALGVLLAACGVLAWFTEGPRTRRFTGRRVLATPGSVEIVLHRWVGPAGAVVAVVTAAYAGLMVAHANDSVVRVVAGLALAGVVIVVPDLVAFAFRPARIVLRVDGLGLRSRTHEATVPWDRVLAAALAATHPGAPGIAVATVPPIALRRLWWVLPLGRRSRTDRVVVPARFSDHPGEIEAVIESLAQSPLEQREDLLGRVAGDLVN